MKNAVKSLENIGLSNKGAELYIAALELGEATVTELSEHSGLKRTSLYYILEELINFGALVKKKRKKKTFYIPEPPAVILKRAKEHVGLFESTLEELDNIKSGVYKKSGVYYLYGTSGFKQLWDMIFRSKCKEYQIITQGVNFLDFVKEKYILDTIIKTKTDLGIYSRQLISDSKYARKIIAKDKKENRESKILPPVYKLPFTEIVCGDFVAFVAPRFEDIIFVIEDSTFAKTRKSLFDILWRSIR